MIRTISRSNAASDWAKKIQKLRTALKMNQIQLGKELQYSAMAVSRWERGIQEPPADAYIKLGKLATGPDRWFFWERAGLKKSDVQNGSPASKSAFSGMEVVLAGAKNIAQKTKLVAIPLLQVHAGSHGEEGDQVVDIRESTPEEVIAAPLAWCPNPEATSCLRVKGNSMSPMIHDGDILAVDTSRMKHSDLNNKIIVVWHNKKGLSVSRFRRVDSLELLESDNREYQSVVFTKDRNWQIVGKVLWLIRKTP